MDGWTGRWGAAVLLMLIPTGGMPAGASEPRMLVLDPELPDSAR